MRGEPEGSDVPLEGTFGKDWIPDEALNALVQERAVHPEESPEQMARRLILENLGQVTLGVIHTALWGSNERTRLDAQKYLMERALGRVGDDAFGDVQSPIEKFLTGVEFLANNGSSRPVGPEGTEGAK